MSNWGVAKPLALPAAYAPTGDVTLTAGSYVTGITTGAIAALDGDNYYPLIFGVMTILLGGSAPSALDIQFILGSGSQVDHFTVEPGLLTALAELMIPVYLIGANSRSAWAGSGSTINVQAKATTNAATLKQVGSRLMVALFRGPDA